MNPSTGAKIKIAAAKGSGGACSVRGEHGSRPGSVGHSPEALASGVAAVPQMISQPQRGQCVTSMAQAAAAMAVCSTAGLCTTLA